MTDREEIVQTYLAQSRWAWWERTRIAGDASGRVYYRLRHGSDSIVVMDAPPDPTPTTTAFARMAVHLRQSGLHPPVIHDHDETRGLMVLSDLGHQDFAQWLHKTPRDLVKLYEAACDVLIKLEQTPPPSDLHSMTPKVAGEMVLILEPYFTSRDVRPIADCVSEIMQELAPEANTLALRDFHAENLIWRPERTGTARVGLLDFQDAFLAPAGYDLISLLRDARRDVEPDLSDHIIKRFIDMTGKSTHFRAQLAILGAQRNLRILGVFARLAQVQDKSQYLKLIPRVWRNLLLDLDHPALAELKRIVLNILPTPDGAAKP